LLGQQLDARRDLGSGRHAVRGARAQQHQRYQRHAAHHHHHHDRGGAGGAPARGADLRSGQRPEDLRKRRLDRRFRCGRGRRDSYSYLCPQPKFISLDPQAAAPSNLQISGMRLGVNGVLAPAGQAYSTLSVSVGGSAYTAANGQLLSTLGGVVPATLGPANDLFFLSFDQLGTHVHAYVEPTVVVSPPAPDNTPQPDFGVATFERINHSLSRITGVPVTNTVVSALYSSEQQSLPSQPLTSAFLPSHQTAIAQLANAYCGQLTQTQSLRDAFFGTGLDAAINSGASGFFGSSGGASRNIVISALVSNAVG